MAITLPTSALLAAVKRCAALIAKRNSISVLSQMLLEAAGGVLTVTATDMDICVSVPLACMGGDDWRALAPAHDLLRFLRTAPKAGVATLDYDDGALTVTAGGSAASRPSLRLIGLLADDFPVMAPPATSTQAAMDGPALAAALGALHPYAAKRDSRRYYLEGVYLHASGDGVRAVATDGHRFAFRDLDAASDGEFPGALIPRDAVAWLAKHGQLAGAVVLEIGERSMRIATDTGSICCKLIDAAFPDYAHLVDVAAEPGATVDRDALAKAVDLVRSVLSAPAAKQRVTLTAAGGELAVTARDPDGGDAVTTLDADGADVVAEVPAMQLLQALKGFPAGCAVEVAIAGPALRITGAGVEASVALYIPPAPPAELERPEVSMGEPGDAGAAYAHRYRIEVRSHDDQRHAEPIYLEWPDAATAMRMYRIHRRWALRHCEVTHAPEIGRACMLPDAAQREARYYRKLQAAAVFEATTAETVPWPRAVVDRAESYRYGMTPADTLAKPVGRRGVPKVIADYAARVLRGAGAPPVEISTEDPARVDPPVLESAPSNVVDLAAERARRAPERQRWRMMAHRDAPTVAAVLAPGYVVERGGFYFMRVA